MPEPFALSSLFDRLQRANARPTMSSSSSTDMKRLQHKPSSSPLFGTDVVQEEQELRPRLRHLVDGIARQVVYDYDDKRTRILAAEPLPRRSTAFNPR